MPKISRKSIVVGGLITVAIVIVIVLVIVYWPSSSTPDNTPTSNWNPERIAALKSALDEKMIKKGIKATSKQLDCTTKWIVDNYTYTQVSTPGFKLSKLDEVKILAKCK